MTYVFGLDPLSMAISSTNALCAGEQGSVSPTPNGGTPLYTIVYRGTSANITQASISPLAIDVGEYDAFVTDSNQCQYGPVHVVISQPGTAKLTIYLSM